MIKIQNSIATREPIPQFLIGLAPESLADLSWTDPALGVTDAAWWPEVDESPALGQYERYGAETLTPDAATKTVRVIRAVEPWSEAEIAAAVEAERKARVPQSITMRQARLALLGAGVLDQINAGIAAIADPAFKAAAQIEFEYAATVERRSALIAQLTPALGLTDEQIDDLFIAASAL